MADCTLLGSWPDLESWAPRYALKLDVAAGEARSDWRRIELVASCVVRLAAMGAFVDQDAEHELASVTTELVENAVKYTVDEAAFVSLQLTRYRGTLAIECVNRATPHDVLALIGVFDRLAIGDPSELLLARLEHTAARDPHHSGIGLIKLRAECDVSLGARIEPMNNEQVEVRLRALLGTTARNE